MHLYSPWITYFHNNARTKINDAISIKKIMITLTNQLCMVSHDQLYTGTHSLWSSIYPPPDLIGITLLCVGEMLPSKYSSLLKV